MRLLSRLLTALALSASLSIAAQTYTPKEVHLEGVADADVPGLLKIVNLQPGTEITKQQIEEALQRLGDTGLFSNIQYSVNAKALTIQLSTAASAKPLPVRFGNFVWWQPAELEKLVEARVPVYHGELPINGTLMEQVQAALIALLKEKGITARVTASEVTDHPGAPVTATAIYLTSPVVQLGELHLQGELPALQEKVTQRARTLSDEDFDIVVTAAALQQSVADVYQNAGYLDVATDPPTFGPPHKDPKVTVEDHYLVDASTTLHTGEIYRIAALNIQPAPPLTLPELTAAAGIKPGDPASALNLRIATGELKKAYEDHGYLGATVAQTSSKDTAAHTASYTFAFTPGELYHFASIDTSALTPAQQTTLAQLFHPTPGIPADKTLRDQLFRTLTQMNLAKTVTLNLAIDRIQHAVTYILKLKSTHP
jgi:outer membrane protein insertion porin family